MAAAGKLRVAAAQYPLEPLASLGAARDKLASWVGEAAARGAELLVLPEYGAMELAAVAGRHVAAELAPALAAVADALPAIDAVHAELARAHNVHILAASGPARQADGRYMNTARLITPDGRVGIQHKCMMTPFERDWGIAPGEALRVFETQLGRIGIAICYDSEFPLLVRAQCEAGAELVLIPSCTERISGAHRVRSAALARALENGCAAIVAPTVGEALWCPAVDRNTGMAGIYVPAEAGLSETGVVSEGRRDEPGWVFGEIDLDALRRVRSSGEMRNAHDWSSQPGAAPLAHRVETVSLV